jgi:hypothetical protein
MDIIVVIDSCCIKKLGSAMDVLPKFKIIQAIMRKEKQFSSKHIGLRLVKK